MRQKFTKKGFKRKEVKRALRKLHKAKGEELQKVKKVVAVYFKDLEPDELALIEQELIQEGVNRDEMKRLCDVHLEVMKEKLSGVAENMELPRSHPIRISMDEHEVIKKKFKKLNKTISKLKNSYEEAKEEIKVLKELSHFFWKQKNTTKEKKKLFSLG